MHDTELFPEIEYGGWKIKDISRRFIIRYIESMHTKPYWFNHRINGWKSIENVAYDFYGSCDYIWAVMIANNIVHPIHDWLKTNDEVLKEAERKYGADNLHAPHHYEFKGVKYTTRTKTLIDARKTKAAYGYVIPQDVYEQVIKSQINPDVPASVGDIEIISNIQWELAQNEKKRYIRIIYPTLIEDIEKKMETLF